MSSFRDFDLLNSSLDGTNLIEASAGTGKTYTITGLVLRLILEKDVSVNETLVVTYTEAATGELKDRIRRRLGEALQVLSGSRQEDSFLQGVLERLPNRESARRRLTHALNDFDQASIFTIHGFCMRTLMDHAFGSGILFDTELTTNEEIFKREIAQDFWRKHFYATSPLFYNYVLEKRLDLDSLISLAGSSFCNPYLKIIPDASIPDCAELEEEFRLCFNRVADAWHKAKGSIEEILTSDPSLKRNIYKLSSIPGWLQSMDDYLAGECLHCTACDCFEKFTATKIRSSIKGKGSPPSHPFFDLCDTLNSTIGKLEAAYDQCLLALKVEFLKYLRSELESRKLRKNTLFFDDLLVKLERALSGPLGDFLVQNVRRKFKAALIDEFQDTDSIQYRIFEKIFSTDDKTLFLIGDPKQAIYGFRGADIFTYMEASRSAASRFTLSRNWRSTPSLISAINTLFSVTEPAFVYEDIPFLPTTAGDSSKLELEVEGKKEPPLQLWLLRADEVSDGKLIPRSKAIECIPEAVAAEISRLLKLGREGKALIGEKPIREGDIAVLVRKNEEARRVQKALSDLRIHSVLYNLGNLFDTHEAVEVERVLAAVLTPTDEKLLKGALATDLMGVTGEALDRLISRDTGMDAWLERFGEYHDLWARHGFFRMFRRLLSREKVLPRLMPLPDGERRCTNVLHLSEVLHKAAVESNLNMFGLVKWLATQRNQETPRLDEHQLRLESDENAVKLVTIHKSKGLEYPVVFCPFLWAGSRLRDRKAFMFHDEREGMKLTLDLGSPDCDKNAVLAEKEQLAENLRLLYVALTRAKNRCYVVWGKFKGAETSALAYLLHHSVSKGCGGLLDTLSDRFGTLDDDAIQADMEKLREQARGSIAIGNMPTSKGILLQHTGNDPLSLRPRPFTGRIDRTWRISSFSSLVSGQPHRLEAADRDDMADPALSAQPEGPRPEPQSLDMFSFPRGTASGILLHAIFEHLDFSTTDREAIRRLISAKLEEHAFDPIWVDPLCRLVQDVLNVRLDSPFGSFTLSQLQNSSRLTELEFHFPLKSLTGTGLQEVLSRNVVLPGGEGPLPSSIEQIEFDSLQGFMKGFIDLVFQMDGRYYIVDWKSNFLGPTIEDYHQDALRKAMNGSFYHLQYYLYTVALHLFLKMRIPSYHYETHFGGVYYIFLRGVAPSHGGNCGIYWDRPPWESIETLCSDLVGAKPWRDREPG